LLIVAHIPIIIVKRHKEVKEISFESVNVDIEDAIVSVDVRNLLSVVHANTWGPTIVFVIPLSNIGFEAPGIANPKQLCYHHSFTVNQFVHSQYRVGVRLV
jgi:hypothetical protein